MDKALCWCNSASSFDLLNANGPAHAYQQSKGEKKVVHYVLLAHPWLRFQGSGCVQESD
jgi:hypothetical protein